MPMPERRSTASHLALMTSAPHHEEVDNPPPPPTPAAPYEVRIRMGLGETVILVAHNGRGEPMSEWRLPREKLSGRIIERFSRWCRENDDGAELHIL